MYNLLEKFFAIKSTNIVLLGNFFTSISGRFLSFLPTIQIESSPWNNNPDLELSK